MKVKQTIICRLILLQCYASKALEATEASVHPDTFQRCLSNDARRSLKVACLTRGYCALLESLSHDILANLPVLRKPKNTFLAIEQKYGPRFTNQ